MTPTVNAKQTALRKARERRLELDAGRDAREPTDRRNGDRGLDDRVEAEAGTVALSGRIGGALRGLLDEGIAATVSRRWPDSPPSRLGV